MSMKCCAKCEQTFPVDSFYQDTAAADGRTNSCRDCTRSAVAAYRSANRDKINARKAKYRAANREKINARERERTRARSGSRGVKHPHMQWAASATRRMRRYGLPVVVEHFTINDVLARYGGACHYCPVGAFEELDHHVPIREGGSHTLDNVRPSCFDCNRQKGVALGERSDTPKETASA